MRGEPRGRAFAWEVLALFAMVLITSFHNHHETLYLLLPPLAVLLVSPTGADRERWWLAPMLAVALALPSVGYAFSFPHRVYYLAAWGTALIALGVGLLAYRDSLRRSKAGAGDRRTRTEPQMNADEW